MENQSQELEFVGILEGHSGWVTSITTPQDVSSDIVVSGSRDKQLIVWSLNKSKGDRECIGQAKRALHGHSHFVSDVVISNDGCYAISGSWDHTLRLWDLQCGKSLRSFIGHKSDVHSVSFSAENRQIVAGGRDKTIKLWNTLAQCKYTFEEDCHTDWVSCVKFSPLDKVVVSSGWDRVVKVWDLKMCKLKYNFVKHESVVHCVTVSPDGSLCASGGKDGIAMLWDVKEGKHLYSLDAHHGINSLCFSPCMYWLCAATDKNIIIWDLENKVSLVELEPPKSHKSVHPWCISLAWSADGRTLFAGCTDNNIYVYEVTRQF